MSVSLVPIYTQTLSSPASVITFNNIPQGYQDLHIEFSLKSTATGQTVDSNYFNVNGSANSYNQACWSQIYGTGTGAGAGSYTVGAYLGVIAANTASPSGTFTFGSMDILNYTSGNYKATLIDTASDNATVGYTGHIIGGLIKITSPITSISLYPGSGNFAIYSSVTVYGRSNSFTTAKPVAPTITSIVDQGGFASINFLPSPSDNAVAYAVTDNSNNTTYGGASPIFAPATLGSATTYTAKAINPLDVTSASGTASITSVNSYSSIATSLLPTGGANVTFTNIPQHYTHLQIRIFGRSTNTGGSYATIYTGFNSDLFSNPNYSTHFFYGDGASAGITSQSSVNQANLSNFVYSSVLANSQGAAILDIVDYSSIYKHKSGRWIMGWDGAGSGRVSIGSFNWMNNSPVSTITLTPDGGWANNTHVALYGIA
jgi:hypothetical protein